MYQDDVKVVFSTNKKYAGPTAVAIESIIKHSSSKRKYSIFVMHKGLDEYICEIFKSFRSDNIHVETVDIGDSVLDIEGMSYGHLSYETLFRLYIPDFFPEDQKILYMDGDMIVLDDIGRIYDIELGDNVLAAAPDTGAYDTVKHYNSFMESNFEENFNAGILLINTLKFRDLEVKDKCIRLLRQDIEDSERNSFRRRRLTYMDQDALNIVCKGKVSFIDMAWNVQPLIRDNNMEKTFVTPEHRKQYNDAISEPKLIHFTGREKPWLYPGSLYANYFWAYVSKSKFQHEIEKLHEEELERLSSRYPYWNIVRGGDIVLYGAGYHGNQVKRDIQRSGYARIVMVVDVKSDGKLIHSPDDILTIRYDQVIVAVENEKAAGEIFNNLTGYGVLRKKITWLFERKCPWRVKKNTRIIDG